MYWKSNKIFRNTEGWCPPEKAEFLCDLIEKNEPRKILEIGVFAGKSFLPMAIMAQRYDGKAIGIEPFSAAPALEGKNPATNDKWWSKVDYAKLEHGVHKRISQYGLSEIVTILKMTSEQALPKLKPEFGLIHQDSNHSEKVSFWETKNYAPLLLPGGFYVLDDIDWEFEGKKTNTKSIVLLDKLFTRIHTVDSGRDQWAVWQNV